MNRLQVLKSALIGGASMLTLIDPAIAKQFDIPDGDLSTALTAYMQQSNIEILYADAVVRGHRSRGAKGDYTETAALTQLLRGTGFTSQTTATNAIEIVPSPTEQKPREEAIRLAAAAAPRTPMPGAVETVVVTAQKKSENIQNVPISVTALSQQQLTERQIAGGPDLLRDVPNMNFGKTNFSGYSIELRGIGTQAISVTTDPAVAVAFNGTPFIRNHFFEQEFYDLGDVEVLRGPQGTLYGRNATAGVVNLVSAKPTDQFEAMGSVDFGNYSGKRLEGMINLPIAGDKLDLRMAGEWTMRNGYSFDTITDKPVDGRDLWSTRGSLRWRPNADLDVNLVWEHFQENDDRMRTAKQLCKTALPPISVDGVPVGNGGNTFAPADYLSQGCQMSSLYSADAFQVPYGPSLPYYSGLNADDAFILTNFDPYAETTQSTNLRDIQAQLPSVYKAKNDTVELNVDYEVTPSLTLTSQTGYNHDFLWSTEDYNRFDTTPGIFTYYPTFAFKGIDFPDPSGLHVCQIGNSGSCAGLAIGTPCTPNSASDGICAIAGEYCDPQLGCSDRLLAQDLNDEHAWQISQELRVASHFAGPVNFSAGGNFLHYETEENYYVFINTLTQFIANNASGYTGDFGTNNAACLPGYRYPNDNVGYSAINGCNYIDPNPISSVNGEGHNYFLSQNPYLLNSYALFGEVHYDIAKDLKLTGGLRWTDDQKRFLDIPSQLLVEYWGYPIAGIVDQQWQRFTGHTVLDWTPELDFTDQTLLYASYAHGYKAGGANPPGAIYPGISFAPGTTVNPIHPLTFKPEYIEAFELGTKNTLLDNSMTLNGDVFYYNYHDYQISRIVDRTAINDNFNAHVLGAELESTWEPLPGLRFNFAAGWEDATVGNGMYSVDLMDRTAGKPGWMVVRPFVTNASNCVLPDYVVAVLVLQYDDNMSFACGTAYNQGLDPVTGLPYVQNPTVGNGNNYPVPPGYIGFDPLSVDPSAPANVNNGLGLPPNNGQGFSKSLAGNKLPNAPPLTLSFGAQYSVPVTADWAATLRGDFYYQADSWARIFNDNPYDRLHGYTNLNLALIFDSSDGWQVMGYVKNVFNTTAITGDFLNSDDTGLTTNVFLTDPRLYGVRVTKNFGEGDTGAVADVENWIADAFANKDNGRPALWIELGGGLESLANTQDSFNPSFLSSVTRPELQKALDVQSPPQLALDEEAKVSFEPDDSDWVIAASVRYGRTQDRRHLHHQTKNAKLTAHITSDPPLFPTEIGPPLATYFDNHLDRYFTNAYPEHFVRFADGMAQQSQRHLLLDFKAGKDVGLGAFGLDGSSVVSAGVRIAQLESRSNVALRAIPDLQYPTGTITNLHNFKYAPIHFHNYTGLEQAKRSFHGIGPTISWDASTPILGGDEGGAISLDWGLNGALLFGRQRARVTHQTSVTTYSGHKWQRVTVEGNGYGNAGDFVGCYGGFCPPHPVPHVANASIDRSREVTVPDLGFSIGASYRYQNAKISFGYRADFFFGAMDGGIDTYKSENRGFFGPFANISIGLGG